MGGLRLKLEGGSTPDGAWLVLDQEKTAKVLYVLEAKLDAEARAALNLEFSRLCQLTRLRARWCQGEFKKGDLQLKKFAAHAQKKFEGIPVVQVLAHTTVGHIESFEKKAKVEGIKLFKRVGSEFHPFDDDVCKP